MNAAPKTQKTQQKTNARVVGSAPRASRSITAVAVLADTLKGLVMGSLLRWRLVRPSALKDLNLAVEKETVNFSFAFLFRPPPPGPVRSGHGRDACPRSRDRAKVHRDSEGSDKVSEAF